MLHIRPEQMETLQQIIVDEFVKRIVAHLNQVFPDRCEELGEEQIDQLARLSHQRATTYGLRSEGDVCAYVDVLFSLHREDESGEEMQWARDILEDQRLGASRKIANLRVEAEHQPQQTSGA